MFMIMNTVLNVVLHQVFFWPKTNKFCLQNLTFQQIPIMQNA